MGLERKFYEREEVQGNVRYYDLNKLLDMDYKK